MPYLPLLFSLALIATLCSGYQLTFLNEASTFELATVPTQTPGQVAPGTNLYSGSLTGILFCIPAAGATDQFALIFQTITGPVDFVLTTPNAGPISGSISQTDINNAGSGSNIAIIASGTNALLASYYTILNPDFASIGSTDPNGLFTLTTSFSTPTTVGAIAGVWGLDGTSAPSGCAAPTTCNGTSGIVAFTLSIHTLPNRHAGTRGKIYAGFSGSCGSNFVTLLSHGFYKGTHTFAVAQPFNIGTIEQVSLNVFGHDGLEVLSIDVYQGTHHYISTETNVIIAKNVLTVFPLTLA